MWEVEKIGSEQQSPDHSARHPASVTGTGGWYCYSASYLFFLWGTDSSVSFVHVGITLFFKDK